MRDDDEPNRARAFRDDLGLSIAEAAECVGLSMTQATSDAPTNGAMRYREWERDKGGPSGPMLSLMALTETVVAAAVALREGRPDDAKRLLEHSMTAPVRRVIRARAPGQEAAGPQG